MPDGLVCFICGSHTVQPLLHIAEEGLPHGAAGHNLTYAYRTLSICEDCGCGQLERLEHDCFAYYGDEDWDMYWWFVMNPAEVDRLRLAFDVCPSLLDAGCGCMPHQSLRVSSERLWSGKPHAVSPQAAADFSWISLQKENDQPQLLLTQQEPDYLVISEQAIELHPAYGHVDSVDWVSLRRVLIETTDAGPFQDDVFWLLIGDDRECRIPQGIPGEKALLPRLQRLPDFDNEAVIAAMLSTRNERFVCWERAETS